MFLRNTPARRKIIEIFESSKRPLSASLVLRKIKVNKTTVYRELETLLNEKIICEVDFGDGIKRYESTKLSHHHHLVCKICGEIEDVKINEKILMVYVNQTNFKIENHSIEFFGRCKNCL